jgi:hypothetical protein
MDREQARRKRLKFSCTPKYHEKKSRPDREKRGNNHQTMLFHQGKGTRAIPIKRKGITWVNTEQCPGQQEDTSTVKTMITKSSLIDIASLTRTMAQRSESLARKDDHNLKISMEEG